MLYSQQRRYLLLPLHICVSAGYIITHTLVFFTQVRFNMVCLEVLGVATWFCAEVVCVYELYDDTF